MLKLNFACGSTRWPGFENSDIYGEVGTVYLDLEQRPYPYEDCSAELVMISHGLQMTKAPNKTPVHPDIEAILAEFYRILIPGGWLRVDDNPFRIYSEDERLDPVVELTRGFPAGLRISRTEFVAMLRRVGFTRVYPVFPSDTVIPCDDETRAAILGNRLDHQSFTVEAQK